MTFSTSISQDDALEFLLVAGWTTHEEEGRLVAATSPQGLRTNTYEALRMALHHVASSIRDS